MEIDIAFDFRADTPIGGDPDALSQTLRRYHARLWGRPLPNGKPFYLDASGPIGKRYLYHESGLGVFHLASDAVMQAYVRQVMTTQFASNAVVQTYFGKRGTYHFASQLTNEDVDAFFNLGYTIGGMMLWPRRSNNGQLSINQARGWKWYLIGDRMDLTLECVRRFYLDEENPLSLVFAGNAEFFALFEDFRGFVDHFLLHDLVTEDCSAIRFFIPFDGFAKSAVPGDIQLYREFRTSSMAFTNARNQRVLALSLALTSAEGGAL